MKKLIFKTVELLTGAKVHADHTAIKGNKSGGSVDGGAYKHWRKDSGNSIDSIQ
jgi:hypothetical protein